MRLQKLRNTALAIAVFALAATTACNTLSESLSRDTGARPHDPNPQNTRPAPSGRSSQVATWDDDPQAIRIPTLAPAPLPSLAVQADTDDPPKRQATPTPTRTVTEEYIEAFASCNGTYQGEAHTIRARTAQESLEAGHLSLQKLAADVATQCPHATAAITAQLAPTLTPFPTPTLTPQPTHTPKPTYTPKPTPAAALAWSTRHPTPTPIWQTPLPTPRLPTGIEQFNQAELAQARQHMLTLINKERKKAGLNSVSLGNNQAAQDHAQSALQNCFSGHWGIDGLKPYMRYSLAGGYQSNAENVSGLSYCIRPKEGYARNASIRTEVGQAMAGLMDSPGHKRNILSKTHRKVNIGIAWDDFNTATVQHFEGDHVNYSVLPNISNGVLNLAGTVKNGVRFNSADTLGVQVYFDPPPHRLTPGQITQTYCYDGGKLIASLRRNLTGRQYWTTDSYTTTHSPCPDPYDVPANTAAPKSPQEAHQAWQRAYNASKNRTNLRITVPWVTASSWTINGTQFQVSADISDIISKHGNGVYTIEVWGDLAGERSVISEYSIFHRVRPP